MQTKTATPPPRRQCNLWMEAVEVDELSRLASADDRSLSSFIRILIREALQARQAAA